MNEFNNISAEDREYILNLPYHLAQGSLTNDLYDILLEFEFLDFKISAIKPQSMIEDFDLALEDKIEILEYKKDILKLINDAIKLSANLTFHGIFFGTQAIAFLPIF